MWALAASELCFRGSVKYLGESPKALSLQEGALCPAATSAPCSFGPLGKMDLCLGDELWACSGGHSQVGNVREVFSPYISL